MDAQPTQRVNLNTASHAELEALPGIGPRLARRIVAERLRPQGLFKHPSDLLRVRGISPVLYQQIADWVYVEAQPGTAAPWPVPVSFAVEERESPEDRPQPIVFYGRPSLLQGTIPLINVGDRRVRMTTLLLEKTTLRTSEGAPLTALAVRQRLEPSQWTRASASLSLDSRTPPGIYEGEMLLGGERRAVVFHVVENLDVQIVPQQFIVESIPGDKVEKTLIVSNRGNVGIQIGDIGAVGLEEDILFCNTIRRTVARTRGADLDTTVEAFTRELDRSFAQSGVLRIRTRNKPVEVLPGETARLDLQIAVPSSVRRTRHYWGQILLYNNAISILLQPSSRGSRMDVRSTEL